jgi:hypothetical protein
VRRAIRRIEAHQHRGVLLLHDIHPATAMALPTLLKELKERGYHIVQAVAPGVRPVLPPEPPVVAEREGWPRVLKVSATAKKHHLKDRHVRKRARHRGHIARNGRDPVVSAAIIRKKRKSHNAQAAAHASPDMVR